jgi:hypothetical protein
MFSLRRPPSRTELAEQHRSYPAPTIEIIQSQAQSQSETKNETSFSNYYSESQGNFYPANNSRMAVNFSQSPHMSTSGSALLTPKVQSPDGDTTRGTTNLNLDELHTLPTKTALDRISLYQRSQRETLTTLRTIQKKVMSKQIAFDAYLVNEQLKIKEQIDNEVKILNMIYSQTILTPLEIHQLLSLIQELKIQQSQIDLFQQELRGFVQNITTQRG